MDPVSRHVSSQQFARTVRGVYVRSESIASLASQALVTAINFWTSDRASLDAASTSTKYKRFVARPSTVPIVAIVCGPVGGAVVLVLILAFLYGLRVRRRVRYLRRSMDVLGPGASLNSVGLPRRGCRLVWIELTPLPRLRDRTSANITITLGPQAKIDDGWHIVSPLSPVQHGPLHPFSTPSVSSLTEQAFGPPSPTRRPTITVGTPPAVPPPTPLQHKSSPSSTAAPFPLITSPNNETFNSLSPSRRHTSTVVREPPAVSLRAPDQRARSRSLSTPLFMPSTEQARSSLSHTRRTVSVDIPRTAPPLRLHRYRRPSHLNSPSVTSPTKDGTTPPSPTRRRRRQPALTIHIPPVLPGPLTPDQPGRSLSPSPPVLSSTKQGGNALTPPSRSTVTIETPPPAARRASIRHSSSRAPIRSPNATVMRSWHIPITHPRNHP